MTEKLTACKDCSHLMWEWSSDYYYTKQGAEQSKRECLLYARELGSDRVNEPICPVCRAKTKTAFDPVEATMRYVEGHSPCAENNPDGHCKYFAQKASEIVVLPPGTLGVPWYRRWFGKSNVSKQNRLVNARLEEQ